MKRATNAKWLLGATRAELVRVRQIDKLLDAVRKDTSLLSWERYRITNRAVNRYRSRKAT